MSPRSARRRWSIQAINDFPVLCAVLILSLIWPCLLPQGPKNKMPPACLWVTCTELGDSHSTWGLGLHKSRCTCKWAGADSRLQGAITDLQRCLFHLALWSGKDAKGVIWSVRKDQPLRNWVHCRGAEWLLYIINQLMRLTLEHLISEKTKPCWRGREDHLRAVEETNWLSFLTTICHLIKMSCHFSVQSTPQSYFLDQ